MKPQNPIKNMVWGNYPKGNVTQWFGENPELYQKAVIINGIPLHAHNGIDIVAPWGTPIYATTTQKIQDVKNDAGGYGKHIRSLDREYEWVYGHLSDIFVTAGQTVVAGTHIANMGNTGFVVSGATPYWKVNPYAGTHLHMGVRKIGTMDAILDYNNGYFGAIDPFPLFKKDYEEVIIPLQLTVISLANQVVGLLTKLLALKK